MTSTVLAGHDRLDRSEMRPGSGVPFRKMHGLGNDFVVIDARHTPMVLGREACARIADRRLGVGCDQLIILEAAQDADARMRIFNPDGGEVGACGNATRCIGALLAREKGVADVSIRTMAGLLHARLAEGLVSVDMGLPQLAWEQIPLRRQAPGVMAGDTASADTARVALDASQIDPRLPAWFSAVNMGNPHAIFFVADCAALDLARIGPQLETHPMFPEKANISLVTQKGAQDFTVRVWERAAGATLACGTAACAVAVAAGRLGMASGEVRIHLPGGALSISRSPEGNVVMRGPVATSFAGLIDASLIEARVAP